MSQAAIGFSFYRAGFNPEFLLRQRERRQAVQSAERERQRELDRVARQRKLELRAIEVIEERKLARERAFAARVDRATAFDAEISQVREEVAKRKVRRRSFERIEELACVTFDVLPSELRAKDRHRRIVIARQFVCYWVRRTTDYSSLDLGRILGGRDHSTIFAAIRAYPAKRAAMGRHLRALDRKEPK